MLNRRHWLQQASLGFGWLALGAMLRPAAARGATGDRPPGPHHPHRARSVILCYLSGGLSQVDSFDPKPLLKKLAGQPMPMPVQATMFDNVGTIFPSPWAFRRRGQSGLDVSELFPHLAELADDLCLVRSMTSKANEHAQGNFHFHSGFSFQGYPSAGAWMSYGLGAETAELPAYVVLRSGAAADPIGGRAIYGSGFLPARHQPSLLTVDADPPLPNLRPGEPPARQREKLAALGAFDAEFAAAAGHPPEVEAAIANYEAAFRMQASVPEACDLGRESAATARLYGLEDEDPATAAFGRQCLAARRLVERGVRFVELSCLQGSAKIAPAINPWDQHSKLREGHANMARQVDRPVAGLLRDLKSRGLLDETIVIFSGEFGRTPFAQGSDGRDHNPFGFSLWLAGGGFRGGTVYGTTDEFGYHVVDRRATVYDLWATVQRQLGLDPERATYHFGGRHFRLSDVEGHVLDELLT